MSVITPDWRELAASGEFRSRGGGPHQRRYPTENDLRRLRELGEFGIGRGENSLRIVGGGLSAALAAHRRMDGAAEGGVTAERTIVVMSTPGIHDAWDARLRRVNAWVTRRTLVVFACPVVTEQTVDARMQQVGSGVLYEEDGKTFVLTAAHVADWFEPGQYVPAVKGAVGRGKPVPLRKTSFKTTLMPPTGDRDQDPVDVAAIYVPASEAGELRQQCDAIGWTELDLEHDPRPDDGIQVCGFPVASPWSRQEEDGHISYEAVPAATGWKFPAPRKLTEAFGNRALFPRYARSKKKMVSTNRNRDIPHPRGFSGGGVWLHARQVRGLPSPHWSESEIRLVGIVHKRKPEEDCLVATRVSEAVQLSRDVRDHVVGRST